jgi:hypothetical protein
MSFKEYVESSILNDADFLDIIGSEIGGCNSDFNWVRLDVEIELVTYEKETKVAEIIANWIADSRNTGSEYYGKIKFLAKIDGRGNKPAKITLLEVIEVSDEDGRLL